MEYVIGLACTLGFVGTALFLFFAYLFWLWKNFDDVN